MVRATHHNGMTFDAKTAQRHNNKLYRDTYIKFVHTLSEDLQQHYRPINDTIHRWQVAKEVGRYLYKIQDGCGNEYTISLMDYCIKRISKGDRSLHIEKSLIKHFNKTMRDRLIRKMLHSRDAQLSYMQNYYTLIGSFALELYIISKYLSSSKRWGYA